VHRAAVALGTTADAGSGRHVAITLLDGLCSAAGVLHRLGGVSAEIRFIGGAPTELVRAAGPRVGPRRVLFDAGVVVVLDSDQPFTAVTSSHLVPTELRRW
jgi:hypothetical protein